MIFETIFFDLDATLYPESNGLWPAIRARIDKFMLERMKIPENEIPILREQYYIHHGTTLRGLQINFNIEAEEYLNFVHDLPLRKYLKPEPKLRDMLLSIPRRRWIFTNSDRPHAERVLSIMGINNCFEGIIDVYAMEPFCKPKPEAYHIALQLSSSDNPSNCALLDDSIKNLAPAKKMGFYTILVGRNGSHAVADKYLLDLMDLPKIVPDFWIHHKGNTKPDAR